MESNFFSNVQTFDFTFFVFFPPQVILFRANVNTLNPQNSRKYPQMPSQWGYEICHFDMRYPVTEKIIMKI